MFPLYFTVLLKQLQRLYTGGFIFQVPPVSNYSTCCINYLFTCLVHQPRIYAFSVLITCLRVQYTYKALTNQGVVYQYIDYIVCLNRINNYHYPNEHTILYVFRAPRYDSLVPLNWYKQAYFNILYNIKITFLLRPLHCSGYNIQLQGGILASFLNSTVAVYLYPPIIL